MTADHNLQSAEERDLQRQPAQIDRRFNLTLGALFVVVAIAGYFGFAQIRSELLDEQLTISAAKAESLARRVDQWLLTRKTEVSTLANTPVIRSMDWKEAGPFLKAKHEQMPWFYIFAHINPDGTYYNSKVDFAKGQNLSDRAHFKAAIEGRVYASDPVNSRTLNADIVAVTSPIFRTDAKGSDIVGVFGGMIDTSTILQELSKFSNGPNSYAFAINSSGVAIAHPDPKRRGNINTKALDLTKDADPGLQLVAKEMLKGNSGWLRAEVDGRDVYAHFAPIQEAKWFIATVTEAEVIQRNLRVVDFLGLFALLLLGGGMWLVARFRRLESEAVRRQREVVEEKSRAKSVFLANMSHELRTPLNGILGYSQILLQSPDTTENARRQLQSIQSSGEHLLGMINRVLDLSKIEAGRIELETRPVDLPSLMQDLVRLFEIEKSKYGASLRWVVSPDLQRVGVVDPDKLRQVITNVVVNAFKYGDGSEVRFEVSQDATGARPLLKVVVSDGGRGMTPEQVQRAFVPFEQVSKGSEGAGLGLSIVNELVVLMGGEVAIDSEPGRGTTVRISVPFDPSPDDLVQTLAAGRGLPVGLRQGSRRILVVDDNSTNVNYLLDLLKMAGFEGEGCATVDEALARHAQLPADLVITDLVMPGRDGFDLIRAVRGGAVRPDTPIIVASASAFPGDQVRCTAIGANAFLPKPVDGVALLQKIASLLQVDYVYRDDLAASAPAVAQADTQEAAARERLRSADAQPLLAQLREAADIGQLMRVQSLIDGCADAELSQALHRLLDPALREQDAELVLSTLDSVGSPAS